MRADRLVAVTLYLQRHGRVTAAELASHLEVSVATARRDLEALSAAGVPVYPQPGRGGGWQLVGGARTDLSGLTEPEVQALFLALAPASGGESAAGRALAKLVHALPAPFREQAEVAAAAVVSEPSGWNRRPGPRPPHESVLREALLGRRRARITYRRRDGVERSVVVEPWRLVDKAGSVYLVAGTDSGPRTHLLDRVSAVDVTEEAYLRPPEEEIDAHWQHSVETVEAARTAVSAHVRADPQALAVLAVQLGTAFEQVGDDEAVVAAHTPRGLAEQLAGWGGRVVVTDAPDVVDQLRAIAAELIQTYREPPIGMHVARHHAARL